MSEDLDFGHSTWWVAKCVDCHWIGMSDKLLGGLPVGDTGDFDDVRCPACDGPRIDQAKSDDGKPELMRLAAYEQYRKALNLAEVRFQGAMQALRSLERFTLQDHKDDHLRMLRASVDAGQPVLAQAMKDHGLKRPEGYKTQGRLYVAK